MFEKVSRIAQRAATSASRRQFLARIGTGAMATAAACAGLLIHASPAWAGRGGNTRVFCCTYGGGSFCSSKKCPKFFWVKARDDRKKHKSYLISEVEVPSCGDCLG